MSLFSLQNSPFTLPLIKICFRKKVKFVCRCYFNAVYKNNLKIKKPSYSIQYLEKVPVTMKLSTPEFKSVITDSVKYLYDLFEKNGFEIRIAGGAVRDLLLGNVPSDIDFATTATPDEMRDLFNKHEIRLINLRGESHGTITPRINETNYEITTLRVDEITDGRHALVKFTKNWYQDANRRDLTINAMFLDLDGTVYDYFNGVEDVKNRRVRFVGDAARRIQEDYLRILRYFRFYGRISEKPDCHDGDTLLAIKENASGLAKISGERIHSELFKILSGNHAIELLKKMLSLDLGRYIGLPAKCNLEELERVSENITSNNFDVEPITILSSLLRSSEDVTNLTSRIKPSAYCRDLAYFIVEERNKGETRHIRYYQKLQIFSKTEKFTKSAIVQYLRYIGDVQTLQEFEEWDYSRFPINGNDILQKGITDRRQIGFVLNELKAMWIDRNFTLTKEELDDLITIVATKYDSGKNDNLKKKKQKRT